MTAVHSRQSRVLVNSAHVSGRVTGFTLTHQRALSEITNLLSAGEQFIPGLLSGTAQVDGLFDTSAGTLRDVIDQATVVDDGLLSTVAPAGLAVGSLAFVCAGNVSARTVTSSVKDATTFGFTGTANDGVDLGVILHDLTARTANGDGTAVDNGSATQGGAVASLHVVAYSGFDEVEIAVEDSDDGDVWANLLTFASVDGVTSEKARVPGSVERHTRVTWDVTGSGSITFVVALARR